MGTGSTMPRRRLRLAPCSRTRRLRAAPAAVGQLDGGTLALQAGQRRAGPGRRQGRPHRRARGQGGVRHQLLDGHGAGQLQVAGHTGGGGLVVVGQRQRRLAALGGHPAIVHQAGPAVGLQRVEPLGPFPMRTRRHQGEQQVVQLVRVAQPGTDLVEHDGHRLGVERGQFRRRDGQPVRTELAQAAPQGQGARPALLERRVVEIGEGSSAQNGVGEGRGLRRFDRVHGDGARLDPGPHVDQPLDREPFVEAVVHGLAGQHVVGHADRSGRRVLLAGGQPGPHGGEQVVGLHALQVDGAALAAVHTGQYEGAVEVPAPARAEHGMEQHRLGQHLGRLGAAQHGLHLGQRKAVLRAE